MVQPDNRFHKLRGQISELDRGIHACLDADPPLYIPALIIGFAAIDGMAWLCCAGDGSGADFKKWVSTYLLPDSDFECDEDDLWGARCGLLHSQIMDSKNARAQKARHVVYAGPGGKLLAPLAQSSSQLPVIVSLDALFFSLERATSRFLEDVEKDAALQSHVLSRALLYYDELQIVSPKPVD